MGIPLTPASLEHYRAQFPALANKAYFNYGGQGPMPQVALEAIQQAYQWVQHAGPFSKEVNAWVAQEANQTRAMIAAELGVLAETITLTENVSVGCNIALWGIDWQAGDHLLLSDCEHPTVVAAAQELQRRFGIEVSTCPLIATVNAGNPVAVVTYHLRPRTRLVALSHIFWNTGQVLPLAEIVAACRDYYTSNYPIRILVDAAQSVGALPLDLQALGVDFYAFTGHKWWCGPEGVGGLYVSPEAREQLNPTFIGWRGIVTDQQGMPTGWRSDGQCFEVATSAYPLYGGLRAAIAIHQQWGSAEARYQAIQQLSQYLWQRLAELPGVSCLSTAPPKSGLVSFQLANQAHSQLVQFLETQNVMVRTLLNPNCVRACVHYFTLESEIDQLIAATQEFCQR